MGVFTRLLFGEEEDEDDDEGESRLNYQNHNISSVKRFGMLFVWGGITIYKAVKGLCRKFISIFFHAKPKPKPKPPYPFLPLHNPPPTQPLLAPPISSPTCTFDDVDGGDLECGHNVYRENLARRQVLPLQNPASTSTNTEPLLLHPSALISSPTTILDDDDRRTSSALVSSPTTILDGGDLECGHNVDRENLARRQVLPLQNPASTSTNTEPLLLHPSALVSSPTTILDDDDRRTSSTIIGGEDRVLGCQKEIHWLKRIPAFVKEKKIPFPKEELKEKGKETEEVEEETKVEKKMNKKKEKKKTNTKKEKKSVIVVVEERWIKHYSSYHRILLVGEGNFSFSACLAKAFRCASNITATSLDSEAFLKEHYEKALSNIEELRSRGSKVLHGIDATAMANHPLLRQLKFDRVVFNFPYAGLHTVKKLPRQTQLEHHRRLVSRFIENAREMISIAGEIHITHKTNGFHAEWKVESLARERGLRLIEAVDFKHRDYPGYNTMCGFGGNNYFDCYPSKTYKFGLPS